VPQQQAIADNRRTKARIRLRTSINDEVYSPLRQYNTVQYNAKQRKEAKKEKKRKKEKSELKHAYTSTKQTCDSVMKISKNLFSNITYITLSSNHVILKT